MEEAGIRRWARFLRKLAPICKTQTKALNFAPGFQRQQELRNKFP